MTGDKQPGVKWSGPEGSRPITLADFRETPGLLAWLFGGTDRSPYVDRCHMFKNVGRER